MTANRFWRDPALPFVESRRAQDSRACYRPHAHPTLSLGAVDGGQSLFRCGGTERLLATGDLVMIPPAAVHSCNPLPGRRWSYQMLHLDPHRLAEALGADPAGRAAAVWREPQLYRAFCRLNARLFGPEPAAAKRAALTDFLAGLFRHAPAATEHPPATGRLPGGLKALLAARCDEPWPLARLAALTGMSRFQLIRAFRAETGMTPHAWLLDLRINRAREMLRQGLPLADIAYGLQFADQAHFQRAFKSRVAATPGEYRAGG